MMIGDAAKWHKRMLYVLRSWRGGKAVCTSILALWQEDPAQNPIQFI